MRDEVSGVVADENRQPAVRQRERAGRGATNERAAEDWVVRVEVSAAEEHERLARGEEAAGRERVADALARAVQRASPKRPARQVERPAGAVEKFDELVFRAAARAVVVCIARGAVGRACQKLVVEERPRRDTQT